MAHNPNRATCRCGKGKVSAWDGKCGHCRTPKEQRIYVQKHVRGEFAAPPDDKADDSRTQPLTFQPDKSER